jgi:GNAT superfamily N-acetyltransferase
MADGSLSAGCLFAQRGSIGKSETAMGLPSGRSATLGIVRSVLAADCACPVTAFVADGLLITVAEARAGRRGFPLPDRPLLIVTMGAGVVVSCHPERIDWLRVTLAQRPRDSIFSAATIAELTREVAPDRQEVRGPDLKYVCAPDDFRSPADPEGVTIAAVEGAAVADLYRYPGFGNALAYRRNHPRPDVAAVVARRGEAVIGIAGASADCQALWQIGVEVVPEARGLGIGRALVGRLTEVVFRRGHIPYYSTAVANLRSAGLALGLGYRPAWCELYAKDRVPTD